MEGETMVHFCFPSSSHHDGRIQNLGIEWWEIFLHFFFLFQPIFSIQNGVFPSSILFSGILTSQNVKLAAGLGVKEEK